MNILSPRYIESIINLKETSNSNNSRDEINSLKNLIERLNRELNSYQTKYPTHVK